MTESNIKVASKFALRGDIISIEPLGMGHINNSFKVITTKRSYILQRINTVVFPDVDGLMNNIVRVIEHLREKGAPTLTYVPTFDGKLYYKNADGCYRVYKFIENSVCFEGIDNLDIIEKTGFAFGSLHKELSDLDANELVEVIPNFHNTKKRYHNLLKAIAKDPLEKVAEVKDDIRFIAQRESDFCKIYDALNKGTLRCEVTHNDTKINNVLFDADTNDVKCVIDLDTVMPGSFLFDFGDGLRSLFTGNNEDTKDLSLLKVNLDVYRRFLTGYYSSMKGILTPLEIELLPNSVLTFSLELAMRFLQDYIEGDIYFSTSRPGQNLDRAKTQIALAKDIYKHYDELVQITNEICK